jgi:AMP phosphorylase
LHNKRLVQIARLAGAPNDKGAGVYIHKKRGESVKQGETVLTIYAEKEVKLQAALKSARQDSPILVEGMLLEKVGDVREF